MFLRELRLRYSFSKKVWKQRKHSLGQKMLYMQKLSLQSQQSLPSHDHKNCKSKPALKNRQNNKISKSFSMRHTKINTSTRHSALNNNNENNTNNTATVIKYNKTSVVVSTT